MLGDDLQTSAQTAISSRLLEIGSKLSLIVPDGRARMDMPVNVPVDDPNADTEWSVLSKPAVRPCLTGWQERHITQARGHP